MPAHREKQQKNAAVRNEKKPRLGLMDLPMEIINMIVENSIEDIDDLNSFSMVNKAFFQAYQFHVIATAFTLKVDSVDDHGIDIALGLFFHAVRHDSVRLVRILASHLEGMEIKGYIPAEPFLSKRITFFHHALIADAPMVSAHLAAEVDHMFDESLDFYPSMVPIYHALFPQTVATQEVLNKALRNACSFGLSRTAHALLTRGADVTAMSPFGMMPVHLALANRRPWWELDKYNSDPTHSFDIRSKVHHLGWEDLARSTIGALLKFGCPVDLKSAQMRRHKCDHKCFRSLDCDHHEQTPLHMAAKGGLGNIIDYLIRRGANPYVPNGEGYTPLYCAIVHEQWLTVDALFRHCHAVVNPVVHIPTGTTALHIACRFAIPSMVKRLLEAGADPNASNSCGLTPLHEVLCQIQPGRDGDVYLVLKCLAHFNADPATPCAAPKTPWDMAKNHPFPDVQEMFANRTLMTFWELDSLSSNNNNVQRTDSHDFNPAKDVDPNSATNGKGAEHGSQKGRRQARGRNRGNQGIKGTSKQAPLHPVANLSTIRSDIKSNAGAEKDLLDFGDDLIILDTVVPINSTEQSLGDRAATPLQTRIASAGWRPKLLSLNYRSVKSNASLSPEMANRDAAKKAKSKDTSTSPQDTKKRQSKKKWNRLDA